MLHCNLTLAEFQNTSLNGADLRWSCLEGVVEECAVFARANTKNVLYDEQAWIEEATPGNEPSLVIAGM